MSDMSIGLSAPIPSVTGVGTTAAERPASNNLPHRPASCDMVVLSGEDSPLRAQILGYGTVTTRASGSTTAAEGGGIVAHFRVENEWEHIDLIHGTITRGRSTGIGVMYSGDGVEASAFQGTSVCVTFDGNSYRPGLLGETIDQLTCTHEAKRSFLQNSLSGEELDSQLSRLEELYQKGKDEAVDSFSAMIGKLMFQQEQAKGEKAVRSSVQAVFARYEVKYSAVAARLGDTWLKGSVYEAAASLRRVGASVGTDSASVMLERLDRDFSQKKLEFGINLRG